MQDSEIFKQAAEPGFWEWVAMAIGVIGSIITLVSVYYTIKSMNQAEKYKKEAEQYSKDAYTYKTQAADQLRCLDMYAFAESFTRVIAEITRVPSKENNNRAGKLDLLFEHLCSIVGDITKYTTILEDTKGKRTIEEQKTIILKYIIEHRAEATVDTAKLSEMFSNIEGLLRKEIYDFQDRINKNYNK